MFGGVPNQNLTDPSGPSATSNPEQGGFFLGDTNPSVTDPSGPSATSNPEPGRFFVNTVWRSSESRTSTEDKPVFGLGQDQSTSSRKSFGIFGKALQQLRKDSSPFKKKTSSSESVNISTLQSIYVADIPDHLLKKAVLLEHFSQYGDIVRVSVSVKRKGCTIHFETHEMAEKAKTNGYILDGIELSVFWSRPSSNRRLEGRLSESSSLSDVSVTEEESVRIEMGRRSKESKSVDDSSIVRKSEKRHHEYSLPDEVQDELKAMAMVTYNTLDERPVKSQKKLPKNEDVFGSRPRHSESVKKKVNLGEKTSSRTSSRSKPAKVTAVTETETVYGATVSIEELQNIMRSASQTAEERFKVLEARDKLMRLKRVRQSDIMKARDNQGTCPDMCPEKERYQREYQRQVASYEQLLPGKMDSMKAIKQYSRSSADQEEPLSHELRSGPVLRMTMNYMIWNLMDQCNRKDEHLGDWYYYIWDRTRSIRKDITQQDLCDETAVTLVEQCCRFHIFCSERMIAEDLASYDDKINTENLTKCLQTLKYMYHDLSLKGVSCPNEAEFRAYFVLLNLSEGDCMWEVQQLSVEVRQAEPVRFALQVSAALSSNNFIRFFKLVRSSTYLNACILHRYFAQVRSQALSTILKAYRQATVFTLEEVVRLTGFENTQEAALLCSHHGLQLTEDGTGVVFSRSSYCQPDTVLTTARNHSLIESKYCGSVANIVSGGLPPESDYLAHIPHDSFDSNGFLTQDAWKGIDQISKTIPVPKETSDSASIPVVTREVAMGSVQYKEPMDIEAQMRRDLMERALQKQAEQAADEIITQVVEDEVCSIVEKSVKNAHIDEATNTLFEEVFNTVVTDMIQDLCTEVITAEVLLARERMKAKQLALEVEMRNKLIENKALLVLTSALDCAIKEICEGVIEDELARDAAGIQCTNEIFQEVVHEQCKEALEEAIAEARAVRLEAIRVRTEARRLKYFFQKWCFLVNKNKRLHESMCDFPAWMSNMSLDEQVSSLEQPDPCFLQHLAHRRRSGQKLMPDDLDSNLPSMPTVNVGSVIAHSLVQRMKELSCYNANLFWKSVVSLPGEDEAPNVSDSCNRWTHSVFALDAHSTLLSQTKTNNRETVNTCLRCVTGPVTDVDACGGMNGVFFWLPHKGTSMKTICQRLLAVLSAKPPRPAIPVAFVWTGPTDVECESLFIQELALDKLKESKFLSQYKFFHRDSNTRRGLASQMEHACRWLAQCTPCYPPLVVTSMRQLVNQCLTDELWGHIYDNDSHRSPNSMVDLYNTALSKLEEHINDNNLKQCSLGAAEFHDFLNDDYVYREQFRYQICPEYWGSSQYYLTITKFVSDARLDLVEPWPPQSSQELKQTLHDYCTSQRVPHIISDIYLILERHLSSKQRASFPPPSATDWKLFLRTLPWSCVLQVVAEAKLESLDCGFVSRNLSSQDGLLVVVRRKSLQQFRCFPWWVSEASSLHDTTNDLESIEKGEAVSQKRPLVNETESPNKQRRLSLSDTLMKVKMAVSKLDSIMNSAKITREAIEAKYDSP